MNAIQVENLTKVYGKVRAVHELSFTIDYGNVVGFVGPNGAGKTTTMRAILGHVQPNGGHALIGGMAYRDLSHPLVTVGAVLETTAQHPGRRGRDHLRILARQGGFSTHRADELVELVGLGAVAERRVGGYSMGMRQRLSLAGALLGDPQVLVLDEPANGLDPDGVRWLRDLLRSLASEGRAVLISSHGLAELALTVDQVVIIGHGRLIVQASLADLVTQIGNVRVAVTAADAARFAQLLKAKGHHVVSIEGDRLVVAGINGRDVGRIAAEHDVELHQLAVEHASLEEIYLRLTAEAASIR